MSLHTDIKEELKDALRQKDEVRLRTIRNILTSCTNELVASGKTPQDEVGDDMTLAVITRLAKQRRESIEQFKNGGRDDLAQNESNELEILERYLPEMMSEEEVSAVVQRKKEELGVAEKSDMGKLMGAVMGELKGKADGTVVKLVVEKSFE